MSGLAAAIEASALAMLIAGTPHLYPALSALHILGIALTVGPILVVDLWYLRLARTPGLAPAVPVLQRVSLAGFVIALLTGAALFSVQAVDYAENPAVWVKAGLLVLAGFNAAAAHLASRRARWVGAVSLVAWLSIIAAGRWIAFL